MLFAEWSLGTRQNSWVRRTLRSPGSLTDEFFPHFSSFITTNCALQFSSRGVRPGLTTVLARNLDKNTMGYLQWRWGIQSAMNTSIVRDTKTSHFTVAMQVRATGGTVILPRGREQPHLPVPAVFSMGLEVKEAAGISRVRPNIGNQLFGRAQLLALS